MDLRTLRTLNFVYNISICLLITSTAVHCDVSKTTSNPAVHFQKSDGRDVKFGHAINNSTNLKLVIKSLNPVYLMLEADVSQVNGQAVMFHPVPGQAWPTDQHAYMTLNQWLEIVINDPALGVGTDYYTTTKKGIKLDFKSEEIIENSLTLLASIDGRVQTDGIQVPIWFNADIIPGPNPPSPPTAINPNTFLRLVADKFPQATLSLGWNTGDGVRQDSYSWRMILDMLRRGVAVMQKELLNKGLTDLPVSFPIRGKWVGRSWQQFLWLQELNPEHFTLTFWSPETDTHYPRDYQAIKTLMSGVPKQNVFFDTDNERFLSELQQALEDNNVLAEEIETWNSAAWSLKGNNDDADDSPLTANAYFNKHGAIFEGDLHRVVLQTFEDYKPEEVTVTGQVTFIPYNETLIGAPSEGVAARANVYVRTTNVTESDHTIKDGVLLSISRSGLIKLQADKDTGGGVLSVQANFTEPLNCFDFEIMDRGEGESIRAVVSLCSNLDISASASQTSRTLELKVPYSSRLPGFQLAVCKENGVDSMTDADVMFKKLSIAIDPYSSGSAVVLLRGWLMTLVGSWLVLHVMVRV